MILDKKAATEAVKTIAEKLNLTVKGTAEGICKIADAKMADAIRQITIRKGIDPRKFVLVAFGGAGPMHACLTAEELGIETILVPEMPGIYSAWGMLQCDIRQDTVRTLKNSINNTTAEQINEKYKEIIDEVSKLLLQQNISEEQCEYQKNADVRYLGQEYTVNVPFNLGVTTDDALRELIQTFHKYHHNIYGHSNPDGETEIVNLRLVGIGKIDKIPKQKAEKLVTTDPKTRKIGKAIFYGEECETRIFNRRNCKPGNVPYSSTGGHGV